MIKRIFTGGQKPVAGWGSRQGLVLSPQIGLVKFGASGPAVELGYRPKEVHEFLQTYKVTPGHFALRIVPMGASEVWGPNDRGDIWPESGLHPTDEQGRELTDAWWGYKSFEKNAHVYRHHFNFDPSFSIGRIVKAFWDPDMHRIELIAEVNSEQAPDIKEAAERGDVIEGSMGAKIPEGDVCSVCYNRALNRSMYCADLREHMGELTKEGIYIGAINEKPKFFDYSIVTKPAAKESGTVEFLKAASAKLSSADLAYEIKYDPDKVAMEQMIYEYSPKAHRIMSREKEIPTNYLVKLGSSVPLPVSVSSLYSLGILLNPLEFQTLVLSGTNTKLAEAYASNRLVFPPSKYSEPFTIDLSLVDKELVQQLVKFADYRSGFEPYFLARWRGIIPPDIPQVFRVFTGDALLNKIGSIYNGYREEALKNLGKLIDYYKTSPSTVTPFGITLEKSACWLGGLESPVTRLYFRAFCNYSWK